MAKRAKVASKVLAIFLIIALITLLFAFGFSKTGFAVSQTQSVNKNSLETLKFLEKSIRNETNRQKIFVSSNDFIKSFVDKEDINNNLRFVKILNVTNFSQNTTEYVAIYSLKSISYRTNGKKTTSIYPITIRFDKDGSILDKSGPKDKYESIKVKENRK